MPTKKKRSPRVRRTARSTHARKSVVPVAVPAALPAAPLAQPVTGPAVKEMRSIWYLVGLVLLTIGAVIFLTGIYYLFDPPVVTRAMGHLQPDLWWGGLMVVAGLVFVLTHRNSATG